MTIPNFTAEATLYGSSKQYRQRRPTTTMHTGTSVVQPQDCGRVREWLCGGPVAAAGLACTPICIISPRGVECRTCIRSALSSAGLWECIDCIPGSIPDQGGGGGGGGDRECCERDTRTGRCIVFKPLGGVCQ
jgi:hypothetical protein